jgi:hypothetical protein
MSLSRSTRKAQWPDHPVAGEEAFEVEEQELLERQEAQLARGRLQADEAGDLLGDRQERLEVALVGLALELEGEREAGVRDEGEGVRGVDGERREDREDLAQEHVVEFAAVVVRELSRVRSVMPAASIRS